MIGLGIEGCCVGMVYRQGNSAVGIDSALDVLVSFTRRYEI